MHQLSHSSSNSNGSPTASGSNPVDATPLTPQPLPAGRYAEPRTPNEAEAKRGGITSGSDLSEFSCFAKPETSGDLLKILKGGSASVRLSFDGLAAEYRSVRRRNESLLHQKAPRTSSFEFRDVSIPHPLELLERIEQDVPLIDASYDPLEKCWNARIPSPLTGAEPTMVPVRVNIVVSGQAPGYDKEVKVSSKNSLLFLARQSDFASVKNRLVETDLLIIEDNHPDLSRILFAARSEYRTQTILHSQFNREFALNVHALSHRINCALSHLDRTKLIPLLTTTPRSINERFNMLMEGILEKAVSDPLLARAVLCLVDQQILPLFKELGFDFGAVFSTADDALVMPLLHFHQNEDHLFQKVKGLALSPRAARMYVALNAMHLRFFHEYDAIDVVHSALLLEAILPDYIRRVESLRSMLPTQRSEDRDVQNVNYQIELSTVTAITRMLLSSLVMLADFGAFERVDNYGETQFPNPRAQGFFDDKTCAVSGHSIELLRVVMQRSGSELIRAARLALPYIERELTAIPDFYEYYFGYYGSDELEALIKYNGARSRADSVSLYELLSGATRTAVAEYRALHRGRTSNKEGADRRRVSSELARSHVLHGREIFYRFSALVRESPQETYHSDQLLPAAPSKELDQIGLKIGEFSEQIEDIPLKILLERAAAFIASYPPPTLAGQDLKEFVWRGWLLHADLLRAINSNPPELPIQLDVLLEEIKQYLERLQNRMYQ